MSGSQKYHVETCIKTLSDVGECESFVSDTTNPLTSTISFVILLIVCHTIPVMLVLKIWYWINYKILKLTFFYILITCLIDIVLIL